MTNPAISSLPAQCAPPVDTRSALIGEVERGLTRRPRRLSPWMFYDAYGSVLFERITALPEYYPSHLERDLFRRHAGEMVTAARADPSRELRILELGAGTAAKTGILLEAAIRSHGRVTYTPCDISPEALDVACASIRALLPGVRLQPLVGNYVTDPPRWSLGHGTTLAIYIGSSIGNFPPQAARTILGNLLSEMRSGDALLLGTDMVKDEQPLLAAYDDRQGITAEFNLNILRRLNRELGANFDLTGFRHQVRWNHAAARIEMHLESLRRQGVWIPGAEIQVDFAPGETIHTEDSHKFTPATLRALLNGAGFVIRRTWTDPRGWYAVTLAEHP